jgi:SAM-dependent methyltransferase
MIDSTSTISLEKKRKGDPVERFLAADMTRHEDELYTLSMAAPFPPAPLMHRVSGLTSEADFAQHGRDLFSALNKASPKSLLDFQAILDFGIGSGRLARMFKDFRGKYYGADVDHELVEWTASALPWVTGLSTTPREPLPCADGLFDGVISVSVFSHMNERDAGFYLQELHRVTRPGAFLLLTIHGQRALDRALSERNILKMLEISKDSVKLSVAKLASTGFSFVPQGYWTSDSYDYGMTFIGENYVRTKWSMLFSVEGITFGGIHDFQDIVLLRRQ